MKCLQFLYESCEKLINIYSELTKEVDEMNNLIIKEYTKHTFHRELNRYLNDPKKIYLGIIIMV